MSRRGQGLGPCFDSWGKDVGLGYSWKRGDLRAELHPVRSEATGLTEWTAVVWRGDVRSDVIATISGPTLWDVAEAVDEMGKNPPPAAVLA